eukprot:GEZU01023108.1.p1 GENE.GEZU01023108.1~~GEZU01023108.1.p1  ORF type:complete len:1007 (+),score=359.54 GEZU01023108.1:341-3361(+)
MLDIAKVADLVLLVVDASYGFEMETFEFLNILQVHGFPKVMGVLTHLDKFKDNKQLKKLKKRIKHRFWTEIYDGAKVFYLTGVQGNGLYHPREVLNLSRFISVVKFRPLIWRNTHPGVLVDRVEDITNPEEITSNPVCNRTVCFYGYVRGTYLKPKMKVVIPGCGEYFMDSVNALEDPCPLLEGAKKKRRALLDKEVTLYAPMSNLGELFYDKDAVYLDIAEKKGEKTNRHEDSDEDDEEKNDLIKELQERATALDEGLKSTGLQLFKNSKPITDDCVEGREIKFEMPEEKEEFDEESGRIRRRAIFKTDDAEDGDSSDDEDEDNEFDGEDEKGDDDDDGKIRLNHDNDDANAQETLIFDDDSDTEDHDLDLVKHEKSLFEEPEDMELDSDDDEAMGDEAGKWKEDLVGKASENFYSRRINLHDLVYGSPEQQATNQDTNDDEDDEDNFFKPKRQQSRDIDIEDITKPSLTAGHFDWDDNEVIESIRDKFVTGNWKNRRSAKGGGAGNPSKDLNNNDATGDNDEGGLSADELARRKEEKKRMFDAEYDRAEDREANGDDPDADAEEEDSNPFLTEIEAEMTKQSELNKTEFAKDDPEVRIQYEGFRPGLYVRIEIAGVPCEFIKNLDQTRPIIVGGLQPQEYHLEYLQIRIKRHRWFPKTLKNRDPLIFSVGWRRFQSIPTYCIQDPNGRNRMLKYTPEHMHCVATIYGPATPQNTGIIAFQNLSNKQSNFRVAATGYVMEMDSKFEIVKKLKLTGIPAKVFKNTAFIKNMFTTELEVAKFQGAMLRTVSGIRGQVKKAVRGEPGTFRATFEDKILPSDIVFMRTWYPVEPIKFYNPVTNLLTQHWVGMRTISELRQLNNMKVPQKKDSKYKTITRQPVKDTELKVPKSLQSELPFDLQLKFNKNIQVINNNEKKDPRQLSDLEKSVTKVVHDQKEKERLGLLNELNAIKKERAKEKRIKDQQRKFELLKKTEEEYKKIKARLSAAKKRKMAQMAVKTAKKSKNTH